LISTEGVNGNLAGSAPALRLFPEFLASLNLGLTGIPFKESWSDHQPFTRMLVKIKKEIIAFGVEGIDPARNPAPYLPPQELKKWLDEKKDLILLDTRNDYEIKTGTFEGAQHLNVRTFREFALKASEMPEEWKKKTIVSFCTGGIRCEKAAPLLQKLGFQNVFQLQGGILKYFEECGASHYQGECFVFDYRVGVNPQLQETDTVHCCNCQFPVSAEEQQSPAYQPGISCPRCVQHATAV
jgi:predicted sulfurtransferase